MTVVAIDGPAGAGKSTVARLVAGRLGFTYLDTGAMYRGVALAALERGVDLDDGNALAGLAAAVRVEPGAGTVTLDGRDVTRRIRDEDVTAAVSRVSAHPRVRDEMAQVQRILARAGDTVMEGRDIGSVIVPDAEVKVFLTASLEERARRRRAETGDSEASLEATSDALRRRDDADSGRATAPLARADDATLVDSTGRPIDEVVEEIVFLTRRAVADAGG